MPPANVRDDIAHAPLLKARDLAGAGNRPMPGGVIWTGDPAFTRGVIDRPCRPGRAFARNPAAALAQACGTQGCLEQSALARTDTRDSA